MNESDQNELIDAMNKSVHAIRSNSDYKFSWWYRFKFWVEDNNPFTKYVSVTSVEEYFELSWRKRHVFLLWYKEPFLNRPWSVEELMDTTKYAPINDHLKKFHPIQYPLRQWGFSLYCDLRQFHRWASARIRPRQKWLVKQIPKTWADKTWLIPELNFAMVVHFVDEEKCFENTDYEGSSEGHGNFAKELRECYNYIKVTRPKLQQEYEDSYPTTFTGDYLVDYAETNRLEKLIDSEDTKYLTWIVVHRQYFWT